MVYIRKFFSINLRAATIAIAWLDILLSIICVVICLYFSVALYQHGMLHYDDDLAAGGQQLAAKNFSLTKFVLLNELHRIGIVTYGDGYEIRVSDDQKHHVKSISIGQLMFAFHSDKFFLKCYFVCCRLSSVSGSCGANGALIATWRRKGEFFRRSTNICSKSNNFFS